MRKFLNNCTFLSAKGQFTLINDRPHG